MHPADLPEDVQIRIISKLDGQSILDCRKASRQLAQLIDSTVELQYVLELALAGMVDGPPSNVSLRDRLDALRAYSAAWVKGEHPLSEVYIGKSRMEFSANATHLAWTDLLRKGPLRVYRPAGVFRRVQERASVHEGWTRLCTSSIGQVDFLACPERNMVMYYWTWGPEQAPRCIAYAKCTFASLGEDFGPHPLAAKPTFKTCLQLPISPPRTRMRAHCLGDLVSWAAECAGIAVDMLVMNWRTGKLVWHMHVLGAQHFRLITTNHVAVIQKADLSISLYWFDPGATDDCRLTTPDDCQCVLHLPPRSDAVHSQSIDSTIGHPPEYSDDTRPLFLNDPSLTVLVVNITLTIRPAGDAVRLSGERFLLFIPISTIVRLFPGVREASQKVRVVPWADWGPNGTRMIRIPATASFPSALGAQAAVYTQDAAARLQHVTIYEVFPLATVNRCDDSAGSRMDRTAESDWLRHAKSWKDPVETTYPFRTTTRLVPYGPEENMRVPRGVWLSHDGLVLLKH
ncbi:hypothetical protein OH77DRAFT_1418889 [Trametes cingulata]|nr:hypothetical protein OH77DRAFT_1418889 [Trametes cingulata]